MTFSTNQSLGNCLRPCTSSLFRESKSYWFRIVWWAEPTPFSALTKAAPVSDLETPVFEGLEKLLIEGRVLEFAVWALVFAGN